MLSDELGFARVNHGTNKPIPFLAEGTILIHGDVAVAYGNSRAVKYADYYVWENGRWKAFFAQQTGVPSTGLSGD